MAQHSRPQKGIRPGDGDDSGAYTADQWRATLIAHNRSGGMIVTGAAAPPGLPATQLFPNVGVFYATADRLAVTSPGASQISIATGQAIVDGTLYDNDTAIAATPITIPAGGVNSRIDRVVVRQNYTAVDYTSVNVPALIVDFNTARIAIISGAEAVGPVAPTLIQDENRSAVVGVGYWDIPLAQYEIIHTTGVISNLTDQREWVDAETKKDFAAFHSAYDATLAADIVQDTGKGFPMIAASNSTAYANWRVPHDYISGMECKVVVLPDSASCNVIIAHHGRYSNCLEDWQLNYDRYVAAATAVVGIDDHNCIAEINLDGSVAGSPASGGELVHFSATREDQGSPAGDTCGTLWYMGVHIEYFGWGRR